LKVNEYSFEEVLMECSTIAESSYSKAVFFQKEVDRIFGELSGKLNNEFDTFIQQPEVQQFQFKKIIMQIIKDIAIESETHTKQLNISLNFKKNLLDEFTISLFGRTKAGKSTIREALTKGNGKSIGKGSQRTTLDVIPYLWNGLRILDVPGIEAYEGDEDTALARDIIDESDMIIFIISDDAVQPGELTELARVKEWNKPVLFVMNIKSNLIDGESGTIIKRKVDRFLRKPEKIFDVERLSEHKSHLQQYARKELNLETIRIIEIHAQAAYLSTQEKDSELSQALWEISKINALHERIKEEINRYGKQRRVLTFFDSLLYYTKYLL
jgi:predicted GTPase